MSNTGSPLLIPAKNLPAQGAGRADGKIFTVDFIKRTNGEPRTMNCRRNVQKGVKGVGLKFDPKEKDLLVVYDMQKLNDENRRQAADFMRFLAEKHDREAAKK